MNSFYIVKKSDLKQNNYQSFEKRYCYFGITVKDFLHYFGIVLFKSMWTGKNRALCHASADLCTKLNVRNWKVLWPIIDWMMAFEF